MFCHPIQTEQFYLSQRLNSLQVFKNFLSYLSYFNFNHYLKIVVISKTPNAMDSDSSNSDSENYELSCSRRPSLPGQLPFDPASLEKVILKIADTFDFRVILNGERTRHALLVTTGLSLAGSLIGKHYGGNVGAALGGAVGGVCGIGIVVVSMRDIWDDIKYKLTELFDLVYDYLAGLGLNDYESVAKFLTNPNTDISQLGLIVLQVTTDVLGKKVLSALNN